MHETIDLRLCNSKMAMRRCVESIISNSIKPAAINSFADDVKVEVMDQLSYFGRAAVSEERSLAPVGRPADVVDAADASDAAVLRRAPRYRRRGRGPKDTSISCAPSPSSSASCSASTLHLAVVDAATPQRFRRRTGCSLEPETA